MASAEAEQQKRLWLILRQSRFHEVRAKTDELLLGGLQNLLSSLYRISLWTG
jgi:hypothetical protein